MANGDEFYVVKNIYGFTGPIWDHPTVYFKDGTKSGHITQRHERASNVGREEVRDDPKYDIKNDPDPLQGNKVVCHEVWPSTGVFHWSREPLVYVDDSKFYRELLSQAICNFPEFKPCYRMNAAALAAEQPQDALRNDGVKKLIAKFGG
jgi:hypothetical protein